MAEENERTELLSELDWLRRRALRMTRGDSHAADDLAQETLLAGLERPPKHTSALRGWLARVLRSRLLLRLRADSRRRAREEEFARSTPHGEEGGAEHPLDEAERLARLWTAVRRLREPYRAAILLRYERGLAPGEIAARLGVPPRTVETRLARGIDLLRRELAASSERRPRAAPARGERDRRGDAGPERRPLGGLAALLVPRRRASGQAASPLPAQAVLVGAVLFGGAGLAALVALARSAAPEGQRPADEVAVASAPAAPALAAPAGGREAREPAPETAALAAEPPAVAHFEGLVVDLAGAPVAGAGVWLESLVMAEDLDHESLRAERLILAGGLEEVRSGEDGRFRLAFELGELPYFLRASAGTEETAAVLGSYIVTAGPTSVVRPGDNVYDRTLVVAPKGDVEGTVRDELGAAVAGALVRLRAPEDVAGKAGRVAVHPAAFSAAATTDEAGGFRFEGVPLSAGTRLDVSRLGRLPARVVLDGAAAAIDVVLESDPAVRVLRGRVVDRGGAPLERAHVVGGASLARTDRAGEFELAIDAEDPPAELAAVGLGRRSVRVPAPAAGAPSTRIVAGEAALALEGAVVDERGEPLAGALVWPLDLEILGWGADRAPLASEVLAHGGGPEWYENEVDELGRFRVEGLGDRAYRLRVSHPGDLCGADAGPFRAGTSGLVVRVDRAGTPGIRGVVRDRDGTTLEGIFVTGFPDVWRIQHPDGGEPHVFRGGPSSMVRTDAHGGFGWPSAGAIPMRVMVAGGGILERTLFLPAGGDLDVVVERRLRLEILVDPSLAADAILVLDAGGRPLAITDPHAGAIARSGERLPISPGIARRLLVPQDAVLLRLESGGQPVLERALSRPAAGTIHLSLP